MAAEEPPVALEIGLEEPLHRVGAVVEAGARVPCEQFRRELGVEAAVNGSFVKYNVAGDLNVQ